MNGRFSAALLAAFLLSGCETFVATAITDSQAAHQAAYDFVAENIAHRRQVRARCQSFLLREVDDLVADGDYAAARQKLKKAYTPLVTMSMVFDEAEILNEAMVCG
jgi:hypothetical protein